MANFSENFRVKKMFYKWSAGCWVQNLDLFREQKQQRSRVLARSSRFENDNFPRLDLKVPKCEIFHLFDFNDFCGIKSV